MVDEPRSYIDEDRIVSRSILRTSALPLLPPAKAAMEAVESILRREFSVTGDEARERVRVEITREIRDEIVSRVAPHNFDLLYDPNRVGPMQIMGVSFYIVDNLPEPGWRVRGV